MLTYNSMHRRHNCTVRSVIHNSILTYCTLNFTFFYDCICLSLQGVEGPRGPTGSRGSPGEGLPGPKVGTHTVSAVKFDDKANTIKTHSFSLHKNPMWTLCLDLRYKETPLQSMMNEDKLLKMMLSCCFTQGDQGLPGEVGAPGERGAGDTGAKVSLPTISFQCLHFLIRKLTQIYTCVVRVSQDQQECPVCQACQGRMEPLVRR